MLVISKRCGWLKSPEGTAMTEKQGDSAAGNKKGSGQSRSPKFHFA